MEYVIIAAVIFLFFFGMRFFMIRKSKAKLGTEVDISKFDLRTREMLRNNKSILYFYTPTCRACKTQVPVIDKLKNDLKSVGKIDISQHLEIAREFGIMGTPATAIMKKNKIVDIFVGYRNEAFLKSKFEAT